MTRFYRAVLPAMLLALAACSKPASQAVTDNPAYHAQVVAFLADHPGVIQEGINAYNEKQRLVQLSQAATAIASKRQALELDSRDYVANPDGKVTVVEFFDYRCPYCKAAHPQLKALIEREKDVRFVFKEMPVIPDADGQIGVSLRASEAALAAKRHGKYLQVHDALITEPHLSDADIERILKENGVALSEIGDPDQRQIEDIRALASEIHASGTPNFVVGTTLIVGDSIDQLTAAIARAREAIKG